MNRPATWKVVAVGAALTGIGVFGAAAANADTGAVTAAPTSIAAGIDIPFFDLPGFDVAAYDRGSVVAMDDTPWEYTNWDDTPWEHTTWDD